ncbi:MAG: patatin-like phospholipase family protein [Planctomycetota bacterium]
MILDRVLLLKRHPCSRGLDQQALEEVAEAAELLRLDSGEVVCRPGDPIHSVFLVIHGRLRVELHDEKGHLMVDRLLHWGSQFGGLAAAFGEPIPLGCTVEDPCLLLRLDHERVVDLTKKHDALRANFARLIALGVRNAVFADKTPRPPRLVSFFHASDATRGIPQKLVERLASLGEDIGVFTDCPLEFPAAAEHQRISNDNLPAPKEIQNRAAELSQDGRVCFDVAVDYNRERALDACEACGQLYWCVTPDNWESSLPHMQAIMQRAPTWRDKLFIVWLLEPGQHAPVAEQLREHSAGDFKVCFAEPAENQGPTVTQGFERLVHRLRGVQIGLALGGGAARGMAHLGVLRALQEHGIVVDQIVGTSAGAMTGILCAAGFRPNYLIERFMADLRPSRPFRWLPRGAQWYLLYKYRTRQFDPMLRRYLEDLRIEQLPMPVRSVAVDLISGQTVVRNSGDAVHGIVESINLPLLATPINREGQALVDGGLLNNVPADELSKNECNFVIAVSVTAKMEYEFAKNRVDTPLDSMRRASTIQTLLRSTLVQSYNMNSIGVAPADIVIEPDVTGFDLTDFGSTDAMAEVGAQATAEAMNKIKSLLHTLDGKLFPEA